MTKYTKLLQCYNEVINKELASAQKKGTFCNAKKALEKNGLRPANYNYIKVKAKKDICKDKYRVMI